MKEETRLEDWILCPQMAQIFTDFLIEFTKFTECRIDGFMDKWIDVPSSLADFSSPQYNTINLIVQIVQWFAVLGNWTKTWIYCVFNLKSWFKLI